MTCFHYLTTQWSLTLLLEAGADSPAVGEVPVRDGTVPLKAAAMDAYRVNDAPKPVSLFHADLLRSSMTSVC